MPIPVACPCGAKFAAQDKLAGKRVKCPKCGEPLAIPAAAETPAVEAPASTKPASKPATASKTNPTKQSASSTPAAPSPVASIFDEIGLQKVVQGPKCPKCGAAMREDAILCIQCGFNTKAGKQIETVSDSKAIAKREEIYEKQREAAEKLAKARGYGGGGRKTSDGRSIVDSNLPIISEGPSVGTALRTAWQILFNPARTFEELPPRDGVGTAFAYVLYCTTAVYGTALAIYCIGLVLLVLLAIAFSPESRQLVADNPDKFAMGLGGQLVGALLLFLFVLITTGLWLLVNGSLYSLGAHLILKYAGGSKVGFGATMQCFLYIAGTIILFAWVPIIGGLAGVIVLLVYLGIAYHYHHKVNGGIAALAIVVGMVLQTLLIVLIVLLAGGLIYSSLQQIVEGARGSAI